MEPNHSHFYKAWIDIASANKNRSTLHANLNKERRSWLGALMAIPYLPAITEWALVKVMPRAIDVLGRRAAHRLGKSDLPEAFWQRLLILGNLPSDLMKLQRSKLDPAPGGSSPNKYWELLGLGWLNLYEASNIFSGALEDSHVIVAPTLSHIRKGLNKKECVIFDTLSLDFQDDACLALIKIYQSIFKEDKALRQFKDSMAGRDSSSSIGFESSEIMNLTRNHPGLVSAITTWGSNCEQNYGDLCRRISKDGDSIKKRFNVSVQDLDSVRLGYGDRHINSQSTSMLLFNDGFKLFYKPRSLALEEAFSRLTLNVCESCDVPAFNLMPPSLDCGDWGYQEFVDSEMVCAPGQITDLISRLALVSVLLDVCGATDCHEENLVVADGMPVLIDGETLFHEVGKPASKSDNEDSILVTGFCHFLPPYITKLLHSLPSGGIDPVNLYLSELRRIYYHKGLEASVCSELDKIALLRPRKRVVFRSTSIYAKIIRRSLSSSALRSSRKLSSVYEDLFAMCVQSGNINRSWLLLCQSEVLQIENGWIPYFDTDMGGSRINLYDGRNVRAGLHRQVIRNCKQRLMVRQAGDADRQIKLIKSVLKIFPKRGGGVGAVTPQGIANQLLDVAIYKDTWKWLFFTFSEARYRLAFTYPTNLYDGSLGIAVFLSLCRKRGLITNKSSECSEIEEKSRIDNESFFIKASQGDVPTSYQLGFNGGIGGRLLSLLVLPGDPRDDPGVTSATLKTLEGMIAALESEDIDEYGGLDIMSGLSGLAGGVHAWSIHKNMSFEHPTLTRFWDIVSQRLIDSQKDCGGWDVFETPVSGFAHGSSGMMCALAIAGSHKRNANIEIQRSIEKTIAFQLDNLSKSGEWLDIELTTLEDREVPARSWCGGAAGALIAAAVMKKVGFEGVNGYNDWLRLARDAALNHRPIRDQICCGLPGWTMALGAAGRSLDDAVLLGASIQRLEEWTEEVKGGKELNLRSIKGYKVDPPGLFVGRAGVGLTLLHGEQETRVKDVLISSGYLIDNDVFGDLVN